MYDASAFKLQIFRDCLESFVLYLNIPMYYTKESNDVVLNGSVSSGYSSCDIK